MTKTQTNQNNNIQTQETADKLSQIKDDANNVVQVEEKGTVRKWVVRGLLALGVVATNVASFFLGRASKNNDDDDTDDSDETESA